MNKKSKKYDQERAVIKKLYLVSCIIFLVSCDNSNITDNSSTIDNNNVVDSSSVIDNNNIMDSTNTINSETKNMKLLPPRSRRNILWSIS